MDFGLSEDQNLIAETARGFLADKVGIERVRELREAGTWNDRGIWQELAGLGLTGILVPEAAGGSALSLLDAALVAQAMGFAATPQPYLGSAIMVPMALREVGGEQADAWLGELARGEIFFGLAITELWAKREGAGVRLEDGRLHGKAMMAWDAIGGDHILVALDASRMAVVAGSAAGLRKERLRTIDVTRCTSELVFEGVEPEVVYPDAGRAVEQMLRAGRIALAADSLGACEAMVEQAVAYSLERKQFNRVIGSFQAVKHMCAEMIAELEPARSLVWYAAHSFEAIPEEAPLLACHALAHLCEIGHEIASVSTQVHGGTGWTDEQNLHFWFKRLGVARHQLGGPEYLRRQAAELQGLAA
ncbi:MAG: acyl-CoA dehydrogenase family protein [Deltaproteobacteria bacterium]